MRTLALALGLAALAGACAAAGAEAATRVTVTVWPEGRASDAPTRRWTLRCGPPRGTHPRPRAACRALLEHRNALRPVPRDTICTQIYGGPQVAHVRGVVRGERVSAWLNLTNGCEIARWRRLAPLLVVGPR